MGIDVVYAGKSDLPLTSEPLSSGLLQGDTFFHPTEYINEPGFVAIPAYNTGVGPSSVAVDDFNGDGKQNVAVSNFKSDTVSVFLGDVNATFTSPVEYSVGKSPASVAVGDFNNNGKKDLAITNFQSDTVSILLGNGDGTLRGPTFGVLRYLCLWDMVMGHLDQLPNFLLVRCPLYWKSQILMEMGRKILLFLMSLAIPSQFCWEEEMVPLIMAVTSLLENAPLQLL